MAHHDHAQHLHLRGVSATSNYGAVSWARTSCKPPSPVDTQEQESAGHSVSTAAPAAKNRDLVRFGIQGWGLPRSCDARVHHPPRGACAWGQRSLCFAVSPARPGSEMPGSGLVLTQALKGRPLNLCGRAPKLTPCCRSRQYGDHSTR